MIGQAKLTHEELYSSSRGRGSNQSKTPHILRLHKSGGAINPIPPNDG